MRSPLGSTFAGVGGSIVTGLKVDSWPLLPTTVHLVVEAQVKIPLSSPTGLAPLLGELGLNVTALPELSMAVHCELEGHVTPLKPLLS